MTAPSRYAGLGSRFHAGLAHRYALLGIARHGSVLIDTVEVTDAQRILDPEEAIAETSQEQRVLREQAPAGHVGWGRRGIELNEDPEVIPDSEVIRRLESHIDQHYGEELAWRIIGVEVLLMAPIAGRNVEDELGLLTDLSPAWSGGLIDTGPSPVGSHATELAMTCLQKYARTFGVERPLPYVHTARLDLLIEHAGEYVVWDHKTSARGGSRNLALEYNQSMQGVGIRWLMRKNDLKGHLGYNFVGTGPAPSFHREQNLPPLPALVGGYEDTLVESRERVARYLGKPLRKWPATPSRGTCSRGPYGRCPFWDKCGVGIP